MGWNQVFSDDEQLNRIRAKINPQTYLALEEAFRQHASAKDAQGNSMMTPQDFLRVMVGDNNPLIAMVDKEKLRNIFDLVALDKTGLISFTEFLLFQELISSPYADYEIAFLIVDKDKDGMITRDEFVHVISKTYPSFFNPDSEWEKFFFGSNGQKSLSFAEFTQALKGLEKERLRRVFRSADTGGGFIPASVFREILSSVSTLKVPTDFLLELSARAKFDNYSVTYPEFDAFFNIVEDFTQLEHIIKKAANNRPYLTKEKFVRSAKHFSSIEVTPLEIDILFRMFKDQNGNFSVDDFFITVGRVRSYISRDYKEEKVAKGSRLAENLLNFLLGSIAGATGAAAVYPIDLVKTRMQNQRTLIGSKDRLYNNSFDCFRKVFKAEGVAGLYRGVIPQMIGVSPEKAIKLTVNDLLRSLFFNESKGEIYFPLEVLAGAGAGASQVIFTNPLEIVKIRLQVQGEALTQGKITTPKSTMTIINELGFLGLYRGVGACLLRDVPFSGIYFPCYAKLKTWFKGDKENLTPWELLCAGALAGAPAASLVTPADVIKTRLQVDRRGAVDEVKYEGISDCFFKILKEEGPTALFKGAGARVFRSSPQFGVTLLSYEILHQHFAPELINRPPEAMVTQRDIYEAFQSSNVFQKLNDIEAKWGMSLK